MSERDYASEIDALAKRIDQHDANIETAANDHAVLRERVATIEASFHALTSKPTWRDEIAAAISPAQADVGEAPAESEWPRYYKCATAKTFHLGHTLVKWNGRDDKPLMCCHPSEPDRPWLSAGLADTFAAWVREGKWIEVPRAEAETRIAAARGEKPRLDDAFPIPAPVEQEPTKPHQCVKDAAAECYDHILNSGYSVDTLAKWINMHVAPELAAKDAEIVKLKADNVRLRDDYQVAVNNIGYRSGELNEARLEIERLKAELKEAIDSGMAISAGQCVVDGGLLSGDGGSPYCSLQQELATLTAKLGDSIKAERDLLIKLVEAEKQRGEDWNTLRNYLRQCGREGDITRPIGAMIRYADDLRSQLSAATAADAERDRAAEAMGWMDYTRCKLLFGYNSSIEKGWFVDGTFNGVYSTPTDAILAARSAEGKG